MQIASFIDLLLSEKNIVGVWALLGAFIASVTTMLGIFLNNAFESRRKKKERQHSLIREAYFGGVEYINYCSSKIASVARTENIDFDEGTVKSSEKFYKLILIGSVGVIDEFSSLSLKFSETLMVLSRKALILQKSAIDVKSYEDAYARALQQMESINNDKKEYNDKGQHIPELWSLYEQHYQAARADFDKNMEKSDLERKNQLRLRIETAKDRMNALIELSPDMYNVIFSMRRDLDRKLSRAEAKKLKRILDSMLEQIKASMRLHVQKLEDDIAELVRQMDEE